MSHFNSKAATWDNPEKLKSSALLAQKIIKKLNLSHDKKLKIMDFGCGTGVLGLNFLDYAENLTGVDTSEGMLEVFKAKISDSSKIFVKNINLEDEVREDGGFDQKFDLIITSMAFHHLTSPQKMIQKFLNLLEADGKMAIIDLETEDGTFHPNNEEMGVKHFGFSREELEAWSQRKVDYSIINEIAKNQRVYPQFLAVISK